MRRVDHPNIISIFGAGPNPPLPTFIILEHLSGGTLLSVSGNRTDMALRYALQVAKGLLYLHELWNPAWRIIHRDIKPDNIALSKTGRIKIFDFGAATVVRKHEQENELFLQDRKGTWQYMAPEVLVGGKYNHKADVYSFAMVLYFLLRGKPAVDVNLSESDHMYNIREKGWRPDIPAEWNPELRTLMLHCFSYK